MVLVDGGVILKLMDEDTFGEFWKIEKRSPILESVEMQVIWVSRSA